MIDSIANLLFRCAHRRLTRPMTPVSKPGVPAGETYVVCLDCGMQFSYDLKQMRIGRRIEKGAPEGVLPPNLPKPANTRIKYALLGSALPLLVLLGKGLASKRTPPQETGRGAGEKK
jgi:hypothetical protein